MLITELVGKKIRGLARRAALARALELRATHAWVDWYRDAIDNFAGTDQDAEAIVEGGTHSDRIRRFRDEYRRLSKRLVALVGVDYAQSLFGGAALKLSQEGLSVWLTGFEPRSREDSREG